VTAIKRLVQHASWTADDGFSLAELMTVTLLLGVILSAAYLAMGTVNKVSDDMIARSSANQQGQIALETMVRELRQGVIIHDPSENSYKMPTMATNSVAFYTDIDRDGMIEKINYNAAGGTITRAISRSNKANPQPSDFGSYGPASTLATIDPTDTTIFRYTDGTSPPNFLSSGDAQAKAVLIDLTTVAKTSAGTTITVVFPTEEVDVRSW